MKRLLFTFYLLVFGCAAYLQSHQNGGLLIRHIIYQNKAYLNVEDNKIFTQDSSDYIQFKHEVIVKKNKLKEITSETDIADLLPKDVKYVVNLAPVVCKKSGRHKYKTPNHKLTLWTEKDTMMINFLNVQAINHDGIYDLILYLKYKPGNYEISCSRFSNGYIINFDDENN